MNQSKFEKIIFKLVTGKIEKYEPIFIVLILAVLLLNIIESKVVEAMTILIYSSISLLYIMTAYKEVPDSKFAETEAVMNKINGFGSAISLIAIQFTLMGFPGNRPMLIVGATSLIAGIIYILFKGWIKNFGAWTVLRMAVLMIIAAGLYLKKLV